jgi:NADH-quinone oxidoreductase subunit N
MNSVLAGLASMKAELVLAAGILLIVTLGLIWKQRETLFHVTAALLAGTVLVIEFLSVDNPTFLLFGGIFRTGNSFADYFKLLFSAGALLTIAMTWRNGGRQERLPEYYALILSVVLGANLLSMSENLLVLFLALELISISSYVLAGFSFDKKSTEGSMKYFLFGSIASAVMLYGFSIFYGIFGTLQYPLFQLPSSEVMPLFYIAGVFSLAGLLYKVAAAPLHPWAPDVYEAAPIPVVAFFSVVPKLAGVAILLKFIRFTNFADVNWHLVLAWVAVITLTVGNFSALWQKNVKRLMAYSSIGQSGFLLIGVIAGGTQGGEFLLFYSTVYLLLTFLLFFYIQQFENMGIKTIAEYEGAGRVLVFPALMMLIGFVGLTGLPPTAGFTGKLFLFSALWEAYALSGKETLLWLVVFGLLNTVVSLFYYLRIPYFSFIRAGEGPKIRNNLTFENLLGAILVLLILILFFSPQLLMGWINKSNFAF